MYSLRSISDCMARASVHAHCVKLPANAADLVRLSDSDLSIHWFGTTVSKGVSVVQLEAPGTQPHAIVVDGNRRLVYDNAQPEVLRLTDELLTLVAHSNGERASIVSTREIRRSRRKRKGKRLLT